MKAPKERIWVDSLLRLILGAGVTTLTGFFFWGPNAFARGDAFWFVAIGITGSLVYVVSNVWGTRFGGAMAVLMSMMAMAVASDHRVSVWAYSLTMMLLVVLVQYVLAAGKIKRPAIGRLMLLGPLFALGSFFLTLIFRLAFFREYIVEASTNNALHHFKIGVGLAVGLELAEIVIRWWWRSRAPAPVIVKQQ
jgi:hypothetical protein